MMKIYGVETNDVIRKELGRRIKTKRIALQMTQKELANESGVSLRMINHVEDGNNVSLDNLISLLRALRIVENIDLFIPDEKASPMDMLKLGNQRKRVTKKSKDNPSTWKWGDEQ